MVRGVVIVSLVAPGFTGTLACGEVIVGWSIPTALPVNPPPTGTSYFYGVANSGANAAGSSLRGQHAAAATVWTSPSGNGSQYSLSSNNWAIGDFYEIRFSALGYQNLFLSWDQTRSSTGPVNFELVMSIDGGANFTTLIESYPVLQSGGGGAPGTWSTSTYNPIYTYVVDLGLDSSIDADGQADVMIRFRAISAAGGSSGSGRIDNVSVEGIAIPSCEAGDLRHVPSDHATIQAAIDASCDGNTILVEAGTYVESLDFGGKAVTVQPAGKPLSVSLFAPSGQRAVRFASGETSSTVLRGFRILGDGPTGPIGGGIIVDGASPLIEDCEIADVHAPVSAGSWGGAIDVVSGHPTVRGCKFHGNRVSDGTNGYDGGAVLVRGGHPLLQQCEFRDNPGGQGADLFLVSSRPVLATLEGCRFTGSSGGGFGARIYNYGQGNGAARLVLQDCTFESISQGAISLVHGWDSVDVRDTTFENCGLSAKPALVALFTQHRSTLSIESCSFRRNRTSSTLIGVDGTQGGLVTVSRSSFCRNDPAVPDFGPRIADLGGNVVCCPADLDGNGRIAAEDLAVILFAWDTDGGDRPEADLDWSGIVDAGDLSIVLGSWGSCGS